MAHHNTVFRQLLDLLPRHEFDAEARQHQKGQRLRVMSRWAQFVALGLGQLAGLQSLRDIVGNLCAQPHKLYHLGVRALVSRSSLARVNAEQPYTLYEALFGRLLARCQQRAPRHRFRFKNKLYAVDASTIDLCLAAFPWASFRRHSRAPWQGLLGVVPRGSFHRDPVERECRPAVVVRRVGVCVHRVPAPYASECRLTLAVFFCGVAARSALQARVRRRRLTVACRPAFACSDELARL